MTPEEKAVIDAAISWRDALLADPQSMLPYSDKVASTLEALGRAAYELVISCPECNAGGHICPGDGVSISHTASDCGRHGPDEDQDAIEGGADASPADPMSYKEWLAEKADASTYPCWECLVDPTEDPSPWCDCRQQDFGTTSSGHACRLRAHRPEECLNIPKIWTPATLLYCLAGDRIRIGQDETDVLRSSSGAYHARIVSSVLPSGKTWDQVSPWEHTELRLDLSANPGFQEYPPDLPCEILCTPKRLAILNLMQGIPGSIVIEEK